MFNTYIDKNSVIHKLNPIFKNLVVILMIISSLFINNYIELILLTLYIILIILYSNIDFKYYIDIIKKIKYLLLLILIFNLIILRFKYLVFDIYRFIYIIIIISVYLNTTKNNEIISSLQQLLNRFKKYIPVKEVVILLFLILKFIPIYYKKTSNIVIKKGTIKEKTQKRFIIYKKYLISTIEDAKKTIDIADVRLYRSNIERRSYYGNSWGKKENYLLILNILIFLIVVCY